MLQEYLNHLQEQRRERGKGGWKQKPSPTFAYELVYGKTIPGGWRSGRCPLPHTQKTWNGIPIDEHLKTKWLNDLAKIKNVEMRASCEGHSPDWVTFIAFRLDPKHDNDKAFLDKVAMRMNRSDKWTRCGYDVGTQGRPRFVCAAKLWYDKKNNKDWENWWKTLAKRLDKAVNY